MKKKLNKEINNEYVHHFKDKVKRDEQKEKLEILNIQEKSLQCQNFNLLIVEGKKAQAKGMSKEEYDLNKDLLKEIAVKKKELRQSIMMTQDCLTEKQSYKPLPAYEIYNL